jgi:hypothetical protein
VKAHFTIHLHLRDEELLLKIHSFFGGIGSITQNKNNNSVIYTVSGLLDLKTKIIPHFLNYPLLSKKAADFILFTQIIELMNNKAHLTEEGLQKIINIKASMNLGLSDILQTNFIKTEPVQRPIICTTSIVNPN